jgi:hypothetical protein
MQSVGGIFASYRDSELAAERLYARGFSADHVTILAPGSHPDVSTIAPTKANDRVSAPPLVASWAGPQVRPAACRWPRRWRRASFPVSAR